MTTKKKKIVIRKTFICSGCKKELPTEKSASFEFGPNWEPINEKCEDCCPYFKKG